jgi:hypothetical protein
LGGLVIDVVIAYLIKSTLRLYRFWGSSKWKSVPAKIDSSWLDGSFFWNCYEADVAYTYEFEGQTYSAIDSKPYFIQNSAKVRVECYRAGETATIRVNPAQPQESVLRQADQQS